MPTGEACRNKFAVAADRGARITRQYDAAMASRPDMADRALGPAIGVAQAYAVGAATGIAGSNFARLTEKYVLTLRTLASSV